MSLLLPCNVVIEPAGAGTRVAVVDPRDLMNDPRFAQLANDAAKQLRTAIDSISA